MSDFEAVYAKYQSFIFKFLLKLCRNNSLAEELTQETFFRAYINFSKLRNSDRTAVWLCTIAKNSYFAWFNQQKNLLPLDVNISVDAMPSPELLILEKELQEEAYVQIHALSEPYREVFILAVFGGISLKDISSSYGKSESWARVTYYRAKKKVAEGINRYQEKD